MKDSKKIFYVLIGCLALFQILRSCNDNTDPDQDSLYKLESVNQVDQEDINTPTLMQTKTPNANWQYDSNVDEMREETSYYAINTSENTVELSFPYNGGANLSIMLRKDAEHGDDVLFLVNKGQLFCNYQDCYISIKFDDNAVEKLETLEADAGSNDVLFLAHNPSGFVKRLKSAESVMIEVQFFDHGKEQFKFDVSDLNWSHF